jgi:predicted transposase YdaD
MSNKDNKPFDTASKYLTEQDPEALLRLLGCIAPGQQVEIEALPKELSVSTQVVDLAYRVVINQIATIILIEMQTVYDHNMGMRMWEYGVRLWLLYKIPVRGYVLSLTKKKFPKSDIPPLILDLGIADVKVKYTLLKTWEIDAQAALAMQRDSLLPLVPLMRGSRAELTEAARRLNTVSDRQQREELSLHFVMLAGLRYNKQEILAVLGDIGMIPLEQLKESSFYQYILEEGEQKGRQEGRQEGLQEGEQKGRQEGRQEGLYEGEQKGRVAESRNTLTRLIAKRFPGLDLQTEIEQINDLSILEDLCLKVIDAASAEEMSKCVVEASGAK